MRDAAVLRAHIGLAGQYAAVDENLSGFENLEMVGRLYHLGRQPARERADELLERFELNEAKDRLVRTYSAECAAASTWPPPWWSRPPVCSSIEPTTGLDPRSRVSCSRRSRRVGGGHDRSLTTQTLDEADRLADRVAVIDQGVVIAEGTS